jgi:MtfA peptidase
VAARFLTAYHLLGCPHVSAGVPMLFSWLRSRRRAKILATPFPDEWLDYLDRNVPLYGRLNEREKAVLRDDLRILVAEKHWEGCGGLTMTDEIKVTIAANAALLLLGIDHDSFARVMSILVYPSGFRSPDGWRRSDGTVDMAGGALGLAWYDGPVILAWDAVLSGARDPKDGQNVVLHEFAHQLDYLDGLADGTPPLRHQEDYQQWHDVMTREFERLKAESEYGHPKVLDSYGATNHAEFFAVATEAFFEKSRQMYSRHPELYAVLSEYYGQDPAARAPAEVPSEVAPIDKPHEKHIPPQALPGKRAHRRSRVAAKTAAHVEAMADWPWWVQFWDIHPGVSRQQAMRPLDHQINAAFWSFVGMLIFTGFAYAQHWRPYLLIVLPTVFFLTFSTFIVWLRLAVRWVDRHAVWGGQYQPTDPQPEESPAPPG